MYLPFFQLIRKFLLGFPDTRVLLSGALGALLIVASCSTGSTPTVPRAINTLSATNPPASMTGTPTHPAGPGIGEDWTTYHRDNARSGYLPDMPDPQQLAIAWNKQLDGA